MDTPGGQPEKKEEIPTFRISPKKVDDSWKEEVRKEREAAAARAAASTRSAQPEAGRAPAAEASSTAGAEAAKAAEKPKDGGKPKSASSSPEQQQSKIFMTFLAGLAQQCLMQLGELESPFSGQREVDIQGARYTIELLATIQNKTRNNLTAEEEGVLTEAIHDLKMRYVEITQEMQRQMHAQAQKAGGAARPGPGGTIPGPGRRG